MRNGIKIMKTQIRRGVFETNSSSTHSLTMMMKDDYKRWKDENLYMYQGCGSLWGDNKPVSRAFYTKDEAIELIKNSEYYDTGVEIDDMCLKDWDFISFDNRTGEYLDDFYEEFTTPSGETIVAFGEYGYNR